MKDIIKGGLIMFNSCVGLGLNIGDLAKLCGEAITPFFWKWMKDSELEGSDCSVEEYLLNEEGVSEASSADKIQEAFGRFLYDRCTNPELLYFDECGIYALLVEMMVDCISESSDYCEVFDDYDIEGTAIIDSHDIDNSNATLVLNHTFEDEDFDVTSDDEDAVDIAEHEYMKNLADGVAKIWNETLSKALNIKVDVRPYLVKVYYNIEIDTYEI